MKRTVALVAVFFLPFLCVAQQLPVDKNGKSPFVDVAKRIMPSVVNISAEKVVRIQVPEFQDPFFEFWKKFFPEFPREQREKSLGSGVILTQDGYILTNNHVIRGAEKIVVKTKEKIYRDVKIIGKDPLTDLALLKIDEKNLPYSELGNSDEMEIGEWVIAIGNPFGLERTVTVGVVSAKHRTGINLPGSQSFQDFIQTDAAINPGNSGGPLVNIRGEIVGINTAIQIAGLPGNIGIGFAVPSNIAKDVIKDLLTTGEVERGYLGIYYQEVTQEMAEGLGLEKVKGVIIAQVLKDSPAEKSGFKEGDIIVEFNGKEVTFSQFPFIVARTPVGKKASVKVIRDKKTVILKVEIGKRPSEETIAEIEKEETWLGIEVIDVSSEEAKKLDVMEREGVLVVDVHPDGAVYGYIERGDVIKKINTRYIKNMRDYRMMAEKLAKSDKPIVFLIKRGETSRFITITP